MEPPIQYCRTSDGVNIAFWAMGDGQPLVAMPTMPWSHLQQEWSIPEVHRWYEDLGRDRLLVRYDGRGFGLSQREAPAMSLEAEVLDLVAVVDRLGLDTFDLYAGLHSGPPAIAYAVRFPERVEHLVLFCSYADGMSLATNPLTQSTRPIILQDWEFYTEAVARLLLGWSEPEAAERFARLVRDCTSPEIASRALAATASFDVTDRLGDVRAPTLVLHRPEQRVSVMDNARALTAGIPNARLSVQAGTSIAPYLGDAQAIIDEIDAFLSDRDPASSDPRVDTGRGALRTILFTDVEGSTTLTQRLGDTGGRDVLRAHEKTVREELRDHRGDEIKTMGDGFMASFGSAVAAVECAIALQRRFAVHNASADEPVLIRIGLNAGEPIAEDDDLFGTAVIAAARIGAHAAGGEILVSDVVRQLVAGKGFVFADRGDIELRGFNDPVGIHEVDWRAASAEPEEA
ncbi:MAG: adenylate/guanylate cyclase domain-containing protein [Acidimicrobiia bacterium]